MGAIAQVITHPSGTIEREGCAGLARHRPIAGQRGQARAARRPDGHDESELR
jgi:hypothetical protein